MPRLTSPRGVVVSVREDKAAALVGQGYKPIKEPKARAVKEATGNDTTGNSLRRGNAARAEHDDRGGVEG